MNRETKYRAWDNVEMKMYYLGEEDNIHFYFDSNGIVAERFYDTEVCTPEGDRGSYGDSEKLEHLIYLEYTKLKDKNDVEIFEGDIVKGVDFKLHVEYISQAKWHKNGYWYAYNKDGKGIGFLNNIELLEVVGNIYENADKGFYTKLCLSW